MTTVEEPDGDLPRVIVTTGSGEDPTTEEVYLNGHFSLIPKTGTAVTSEVMGIRGRGNSTWGLPKKPWRVKFDAKASLPGMSATQKNWILLAEYFDRSRLNNYFAFTLGALMKDGLGWTPQYQHVSLTMNGTYRGLYGFTDMVKMEKGRVPGTAASETGDGSDGDWLLEITNKEAPYQSAASDDPGFTTPNVKMWVAYDDPEAPTFAQHCWIEDRLDLVEAALKSKDWSGAASLMDYTSFADWYLINELIANNDSWNFWSSCKVHTRDKGVVVMGPLWDHDLSNGNGWDCVISPVAWRVKNGTSWIDSLWLDPNWRAVAHQRWSKLLGILGSGLPLGDGTSGSVSQFFDAQATRIRPYALADDDVWGTNNSFRKSTFEDDVSARKTWLSTRIDWLTEKFPW